MTIQKIAKKQLDTPTPLYFARKGTAEAFWFDRVGVVRRYTDANPVEGLRTNLDADQLAATDWRVIATSL